jgi:hypothetical protein
VDVLIDKRELLEKARERRLNLQLMEKDYVLGWLLFGLTKIDGLAFKGGTALAKVYFPQTWRLSEDLDFAFQGADFDIVIASMEDIFAELRKMSGITFSLKSKFSNPEYLQLKIGYSAVIGKNWAKIDITKENVLVDVHDMQLSRTYSDYPDFTVRVESLEEIFAEKLRALLERNKSRDYYDIWRLGSTDFQKNVLKDLFERKCALKGIKLAGINQFFPHGIYDILKPYWEGELSRLVNPLPDLQTVLADLQVTLGFLNA